MPEDGRPYRHGIREAMGVLSGQWDTAVLASLSEKPMTYSELLHDINETEQRADQNVRGNLSNKVLTETLRRMQRNGLLAKIERPSTFGNTWYNLTSVGRSLLRALRPLAKWADENGHEVRAAQAAHEAAQAASKPDS